MSIAYILFSATRQLFYVGSSREDSVNNRLESHNAGRVRSTKSGRPWRVVYVDNFDNYTDARKREIFLKTGVGRKWINGKFGSIKRKVE